VAVSYELVIRHRGHEHTRRYTSEDALAPGSTVVLDGRYWLVDRLEDGRAGVAPARYRLVLRHPGGDEEAGAFRRFQAGAPRAGHQLTTLEDGAPIGWQVTDGRLARDDQGAPYLELIAERDYSEAESLPDHQLEHALDRGDEEAVAAEAALARAQEAGLSIELVALEAGEAPDWDEAERFLDALILEEVSDYLLVLCGVDPSSDAQETWLDTVKERLRDDLRALRADIEGPHDQVEEWDFRGGRVFAAVGAIDDESDPNSGYGWMCRLVDADALGAAGFERVRRAELLP
jgi:hypothetical protein